MAGEDVVAGLRDPQAQGLERVPVRTREASVTLSGWRLSVLAEQGSGAIVMIETGSEEPRFRGDGIFLGWSQIRLAEAYHALLPAPEESASDSPQLG